ncbi:hypothetical protein CVT24_001966 [Panaeolus cyanescens]|uniref:Pheromone n=1 Tax=Panaeolus cyanescens TaxID=181874 RepID=A0A409YHR6_9AGAR|nr:hypothetical protein CVT24_001966 [Panaeolus cyanescens]
MDSFESVDFTAIFESIESNPHNAQSREAELTATQPMLDSVPVSSATCEVEPLADYEVRNRSLDGSTWFCVIA